MAGPPAARDWRLWAVLGLFGLVLALQLAAPRLDSDQAVTGLIGLHVLRGELPVFFWRQHHAGVPESYGAAVAFALLGVSRLALSLAPAAAALGLMLALYRTGAVLFGRTAGILAVLFATVVGPYTASHYVLARAYYVEQLLLAQLVLLGAALWLRHGRTASPGARSRILVAMGLAGGIGLYCGFQVAGALLPAALALLLVDPRLPLRREAWLGAGAFLLGSAPFWVYNLTHDWATFGVGVRFQGRHTAAEAARRLAGQLLPVVLGAKDQAGGPYLLGGLGLLPVLAAAAAVVLLAVRACWALARLRRDPERAGEALVVVTAAAVLGLVWYGRYVQVPRYLLPLVPVLALALARACQLVARVSRPAAVAAAALYLLPVTAALAADLTVLWPTSRADDRAARENDAALFAFLREKGLTRVYSYEYWLAPRLTFDAGETVVVAEPFRDRHPPYTQAVDASREPAYLLRGSVGRFENWLAASGVRAQQATVGPYTVFWGFRPPPGALPVPRAGWRVATTAGQGTPEAVTDGRLPSHWASAAGPPGSAAIEVELPAPRRLAGLALVTYRADHVPADLEVAAVDGPGPARPLVRLDTGGFTSTWRNGAIRTVPGRTLVVRFPPVETRRLRLTDHGPGGAWAVSELFLLAPADGARPDAEVAHLLAEAGRHEAAGRLGPALVGYGEAMARAPDDPAGYASFARVADEAARRTPSPVARAARFADLGLWDEAGALYGGLAALVGADATHVELTRRRLALATRAGRAAEAAKLRAELDHVLAPRRRAGATFAREAELVDYAVSPARVRPGETVELTYRWRVSATRREGLVGYTHFRGGPAARFGDDRPLPRPLPGLDEDPQDVVERRRVTVPADARPGAYRVVVGVWDPARGERVRRWWRGLVPTTRHVAELGTVEVLARP